MAALRFKTHYQLAKEILSFIPERYLVRIKTLSLLDLLMDTHTQTLHHMLDVAKITTQIVKNIHLEDPDTVIIAAALHDIGKAGDDFGDEIPFEERTHLASSDLRKRIRKHPQRGATALRKLGFSSDVTNIVAAHHESYNATGYPKELQNGKIPPGSRIIKVADSISAMKLRKCSSYERIASELTGLAGTQYDPAIIAATLQLNEFSEVQIEPLYCPSNAAYHQKFHFLHP